MSAIQTSIIIPVFDDPEGLVTTLESVKYYLGARKDIEIIACNDGGAEKISKIIASYNVTEVYLSENMGAYAARNKGVEASKGEILVFLDADQKITEDWYEAGKGSLSKADYAGGQIKIITGDNPSCWELLDYATAFPVQHYINTSHFAPTANLFVRKYVFKKVGKFNERLRSGGDFEFGDRVFKNGFRQTYAINAITLHPARNKKQQFKKLKRTARGYAEINLLLYGKNKIFFILCSIKQIVFVPFEMIWRLIRYPLLDYWKKNKTTFHFIYMKKFKKLIYAWNLMTSSIAILLQNKIKN